MYDWHLLTPEEVEPLGNYGILKNDEEELMLILPGYFKGREEKPVLYYDGGAHGLMVRGHHQGILCDQINPQLRQVLAKADRILVSEQDSCRRYAAKVVITEGIEAFGEEILNAHPIYFPHHPFPVLDGTFNRGEALCEYCRRPAKIYYKGKAENGRISTVCPICLEAGEPVFHQAGLFPDMDERCLDKKNWNEVFGATPPFFHLGEPGKLWGVHCDALGIFLGRLEPEDLIPELIEALEETWDNEMNRFAGEDPGRIWGMLERGEEDICAYLFRCSECQKVYVIFL